MKHKKIRIAIITAIIVVVVATPFIVINIIAASKASNYLKNKYDIEMKYHHLDFIWYDAQYYRAYFYPKDTPDMIFKVALNTDFTLKEERTNEFGNRFIPDNYYLSYFEYHAKKELMEKLKNYSEITKINVFVNAAAIASYKVPPEINDKMQPSEMQQYIESYYIIVYLSPTTDMNDESQKERLIEIVKEVYEMGYTTDDISFRIENNFRFYNVEHITDGLSHEEIVGTIEQ